MHRSEPTNWPVRPELPVFEFTLPLVLPFAFAFALQSHGGGCGQPDCVISVSMHTVSAETVTIGNENLFFMTRSSKWPHSAAVIELSEALRNCERSGRSLDAQCNTARAEDNENAR